MCIRGGITIADFDVAAGYSVVSNRLRSIVYNVVVTHRKRFYKLLSMRTRTNGRIIRINNNNNNISKNMCHSPDANK